ncbi:MAG: hypothetical protein H6550_15915 [Chitinophagales bacterium]|nr:hypothetical protein [Chitinophagales bacterium]
MRFTDSGLGFGIAFSLYDNFSHTSRKIQGEMRRLELGADRLHGQVNRSMAMAAGGVGMLFTSFLGLNQFIKAAKIDARFQMLEFGIENFVQSAVKAQQVIAGIKKDALQNPVFEYDAMLEANTMLISGGVASEQAARIVKNMTTIMFATGKGNEELRRMGVNLQQLAMGAFNMRDVIQFGYAGVPLIELFKRYLGMDITSKGAASKLTVDMVDEVLKRATASGTVYAKSLQRVMETVEGRIRMLHEMVNFSYREVGKAIRRETMGMLEWLAKVMGKLQSFLQTPLGQWFARTALKVTVLVAAFGALILSAAILRWSLFGTAAMMTRSTQATVMQTLATKGLTAAWAKLGWVFIKSIPKMIAAVAPLAAVAAGIYAVYRGVKEFDTFYENSALLQPRTGFMGFLQKLGGAVRWMMMLFRGFEVSSKGVFDIDGKMYRAMVRLGMGDWARNMAMWVGRLIYAWRGFKTGVRDAVGYFIGLIENLLNKLGLFQWWSTKASGTLEAWALVGRKVGIILGAVLGGLLVYMGFMIARTVMLAAVTLVQAGAMFLAYWPIYVVIGLIVAALITWWTWSDRTTKKMTAQWGNMNTVAQEYFGGMENMDMAGLGTTMGTHLVQGFSDAIQSWDVAEELRMMVRNAWRGFLGFDTTGQHGYWEYQWMGLKNRVFPYIGGIIKNDAKAMAGAGLSVMNAAMTAVTPWTMLDTPEKRAEAARKEAAARKFNGPGVPSIPVDSMVAQRRDVLSRYNDIIPTQRGDTVVNVYLDGQEIAKKVAVESMEQYQWMLGTRHSE